MAAGVWELLLAADNTLIFDFSKIDSTHLIIPKNSCKCIILTISTSVCAETAWVNFSSYS